VLDIKLSKRWLFLKSSEEQPVFFKLIGPNEDA